MWELIFATAMAIVLTCSMFFAIAGMLYLLLSFSIYLYKRLANQWRDNDPRGEE